MGGYASDNAPAPDGLQRGSRASGPLGGWGRGSPPDVPGRPSRMRKNAVSRRALSSTRAKLAPWLLKTVLQAGSCIDFGGFGRARADSGHG
jgi:hypothetical protein